jgi:predicted deacylase
MLYFGLYLVSAVFGFKSSFRASSLLQTGPHSFPKSYHTAFALFADLADTLKACKQPVSSDLDALVPWVKIGPQDGRKAFALAGEHARELIPVEVSLALIKSLCESSESSQMSWLVVPLANRSGRAKVEAGDFCWRANGNGVDINRNWSRKFFRTNPDISDTYGGDHEFSEAETSALRDLVSNFSPEIFVSIHSGFRGILLPWAASDEFSEFSGRQQKMESVLEPLRRKFCADCALGQARDVLQYSSPGTCLDWVFKHISTIRLSFAITSIPWSQMQWCSSG